MKQKFKYTILIIAIVIATNSCNTPHSLYKQGFRMAKVHNEFYKTSNSKINIGEIEKKVNPINDELLNLDEDIISSTVNIKQPISEDLKKGKGNFVLYKKTNPIKPLIQKQLSKLKTVNEDGSAKKIDGFAIAGFCTAIVGLFLLSVVFGPVGLILSGVGFARNLAGKSKGLGFSIAGIALGILDVVVWILIWSFLIY